MTNAFKAMQDNPMNWKDWITAIGLVLTLSTVLIQGGRLIERQDAMAKRIDTTGADLHRISQSLVLMQLEIASMKGVDAVRVEQINALRGEVAALKSKPQK